MQSADNFYIQFESRSGQTYKLFAKVISRWHSVGNELIKPPCRVPLTHYLLMQAADNFYIQF